MSLKQQPTTYTWSNKLIHHFHRAGRFPAINQKEKKNHEPDRIKQPETLDRRRANRQRIHISILQLRSQHAASIPNEDDYMRSTREPNL